MKYGSTEKLLRVNLTTGAVKIETLDDELYRLYPGGKALAAYLLIKQLPAHADPLGQDNRLVIANGLLTGAPFSTASRFTIAALSPLTGGYGESEAGGFWGPELKNAGFEAILVEGQSPHPVYLWVADGQAELRDARHLWGREPAAVQAAIREELRDDLIRVLQIGLGGENRIRYAAVTSDLRHFNGRNGMGAVFGSKNLKAIAVRGHGRYLDLAYDPRGLIELGRLLARQIKEHPLGWDLYDKGTPGILGGLNASGILPTRNFHAGVFEGVDDIKWEAYQSKILTARRSCYACAVRCKRAVEVTEGPYRVSETYGGPEYEAVAGFGSNCGISNLEAIALANELCNRFTLDTISTSATIAFAMECFEHGLLTPGQTGGLDLCFGNVDAMLRLIEKIATREGLGDLLAEGSARAARVIGGEAPFFTIEVKGQELSMHDPRGKVAVGIGFAVSEIGADHLVSFHDTLLQNPDSVSFKGATALGISKALPARELSPEKVRTFWIGENWSSFEKTVGLCYFGPAPRSFIQVNEVLQAMRLATGRELNVQDLLTIGERATNLARVLNVREGFTSAKDRLPERMFAPLEAGALKGVAISRSDFQEALQQLYLLKGWDPQTGIPTRQRLEALALGWCTDWIGAT